LPNPKSDWRKNEWLGIGKLIIAKAAHKHLHLITLSFIKFAFY